MTVSLKVAFCLCKDVTLSDFITPAEILGAFGMKVLRSPINVHFHYLASTMDPIVSSLGENSPKILPTLTYASALEKEERYDVLWVPAGPGPDLKSGEWKYEAVQLEFLRVQGPKVKYIMSVCAGSGILAQAGLLKGKRATTNKYGFKMVKAFSPKDIEWVAKARWVVDGNVWTSSGVSAGSDMALAFVEHLTNKDFADLVRGVGEVTQHNEDDDPFAAVHNLL